MKTVKRHAKVGERILITEPWGATDEEYKKGDVLKVIQTEGVSTHQHFSELSEGVVMAEGHSVPIYAEEYEVIIGEETEQ